ncbi:hypothetical protein FHX81_4137 [Saccharothrix saharensis]|uniref:Uncharacterized protein n=1 Tax=Saccharothrix saharensis TaxID=571190 RepID=A0A543JG58_9PSEU|nr:hypothetical protein [Saccharothrix saharensis]TQM81761.1 hypothetical protein FHX81_4137 [Saccharothrix saharensis]
MFDAATSAHLGSATPADQATREQVAALLRTWARKAQRLRTNLAAAERSRRARYAAVTTAAPAKRLGAVTAAEAESELGGHGLEELTRLSRPDLLPHAPPPAGWVLPVDLDRLAAEPAGHTFGHGPGDAADGVGDSGVGDSAGSRGKESV